MTKIPEPDQGHRTRSNVRSQLFYAQNDGDPVVAAWPDTNIQPHLAAFNAQVQALAAAHDTETDANPQDTP